MSKHTNERTETHARDSISRQAAIDALLGITAMRNTIPLDSAIFNIKKLPSAQPEIIRCKDCIYFDRYVDGLEKYQWDGFCADWARNTYEDWYCSRAERRTDG